MSFRATILFCALIFHTNSHASEGEIIEEWTSYIKEYFAQENRDLFSHGTYADSLVGLDKDIIVDEISSSYADCIVSGLVRLAKEHSIQIEEVYGAFQQGLPESNLFSYEEIYEKTGDCARTAFRSAGIDYD